MSKVKFRRKLHEMKEFGPRRCPWRPLGSATVDHLLCSNEIDILGKWEENTPINKENLDLLEIYSLFNAR